MVQELRQLVFAPPEVVEALEVYRDQYEDFLPAGHIRVKGVAKNGAVRVEVVMKYGATKQSANFDVSADDMIRALICGCRDLGIPIPRSGEKTLQGSSAGVSLNIRLDPTREGGRTDVSLDEFSAARPLMDA